MQKTLSILSSDRRTPKTLVAALGEFEGHLGDDEALHQRSPGSKRYQSALPYSVTVVFAAGYEHFLLLLRSR